MALRSHYEEEERKWQERVRGWTKEYVKLARMVVRAFYERDVVQVLDALVMRQDSERFATETRLAQELSLGVVQTRRCLLLLRRHGLVRSQAIEDSEVEAEDERKRLAEQAKEAAEGRGRVVIAQPRHWKKSSKDSRWYMDYPHFAKVLKFRFDKMVEMLSAADDVPQLYRCRCEDRTYDFHEYGHMISEQQDASDEPVCPVCSAVLFIPPRKFDGLNKRRVNELLGSVFTQLTVVQACLKQEQNGIEERKETAREAAKHTQGDSVNRVAAPSTARAARSAGPGKHSSSTSTNHTSRKRKKADGMPWMPAARQRVAALSEEEENKKTLALMDDGLNAQEDIESAATKNPEEELESLEAEVWRRIIKKHKRMEVVDFSDPLPADDAISLAVATGSPSAEDDDDEHVTTEEPIWTLPDKTQVPISLVPPEVVQAMSEAEFVKYSAWADSQLEQDGDEWF